MKGQPGISLLLAIVLAGNGAAISGQECDVTQRPSAAALLFATPSTHGTGVYVLDEDLGRRYLITAYHNVYAQADIQVAGLNRALARPLHALVDQVLYAPDLDLAVYPCAANCQRLLEGGELDRRPMLMLNRQIRGHDLDWQQRLAEAEEWKERYLRFTEELPKLGVDERTLRALEDLLNAGAFDQVRARIHAIKQQLHARLADLAYLEGLSYQLEAFDHAAALPHYWEAHAQDPENLRYVLAYATALGHLARYRERVEFLEQTVAGHTPPDPTHLEAYSQYLDLLNALDVAYNNLPDHRKALETHAQAIVLQEAWR